MVVYDLEEFKILLETGEITIQITQVFPTKQGSTITAMEIKAFRQGVVLPYRLQYEIPLHLKELVHGRSSEHGPFAVVEDGLKEDGSVTSLEETINNVLGEALLPVLEKTLNVSDTTWFLRGDTFLKWPWRNADVEGFVTKTKKFARKTFTIMLDSVWYNGEDNMFGMPLKLSQYGAKPVAPAAETPAAEAEAKEEPVAKKARK